MSNHGYSCFRKSYLDVSRKISLKELALMLPGDVRSAWKLPREYSAIIRYNITYSES